MPGRSPSPSDDPLGLAAEPSDAHLDTRANRAAVKWTAREQVGRLLWDLAQPAFRFSPRQLWGWRRFMLRMFGARVGREAHIYPSVRIAVPWNLEIADQASVGEGAILYALGRITLGPQSTVSQYAHLCAGTHDYRRNDSPLLKPPIRVGRGAWVCAQAFVGPNVSIGEFAIVGAGSVVVHAVEPWTIVAGNPARFVRTRPEFVTA